MNLVLDDAEEVEMKQMHRKPLGKFHIVYIITFIYKNILQDSYSKLHKLMQFELLS